MANPRREANRRRARGAEVDYERFDSRSASPKGFHGSPRQTEQQHGGEYAGGGELTIGHGPGPAASRVKPQMSSLPFQGGGEYPSPKGMKMGKGD